MLTPERFCRVRRASFLLCNLLQCQQPMEKRPGNSSGSQFVLACDTTKGPAGQACHKFKPMWIMGDTFCSYNLSHSTSHPSSPSHSCRKRAHSKALLCFNTLWTYFLHTHTFIHTSSIIHTHFPLFSYLSPWLILFLLSHFLFPSVSTFFHLLLFLLSSKFFLLLLILSHLWRPE